MCWKKVIKVWVNIDQVVWQLAPVNFSHVCRGVLCQSTMTCITSWVVQTWERQTESLICNLTTFVLKCKSLVSSASWHCCMIEMKHAFYLIFYFVVFCDLCFCNGHWLFHWLFFLLTWNNQHYFLSAGLRYPTPDPERANAPAAPGGPAGRARLHCGNAHPQRCGHSCVLWCPVYTRDSWEGRVDTLTPVHTVFTICFILMKYEGNRDLHCTQKSIAAFILSSRTVSTTQPGNLGLMLLIMMHLFSVGAEWGSGCFTIPHHHSVQGWPGKV